MYHRPKPSRVGDSTVGENSKEMIQGRCIMIKTYLNGWILLMMSMESVHCVVDANLFIDILDRPRNDQRRQILPYNFKRSRYPFPQTQTPQLMQRVIVQARASSYRWPCKHHASLSVSSSVISLSSESGTWPSRLPPKSSS